MVIKVGNEFQRSCKFDCCWCLLYGDLKEILFNSNPNPKSNIKCKICNSSESVRSMAMHLKWAHNLSTQEYVKDCGEYRSKNLKTLKNKKPLI